MTEVLRVCVGQLSYIKLLEDSSSGRVDIEVHVPYNIILKRKLAIYGIGFALKQAKLIMIRNYYKFDYINVKFSMAIELNVLIAAGDLGLFVEPSENKQFKYYLSWPVVIQSTNPLYFQFMVIFDPKKKHL